MSHSVYVYLQQNDFAEIISLISSMRGKMISNKGELIKEPQFDTTENQVFSVFSNDTVSDNGFDFRQAEKYDHITVTQQQVLGGMLQPMNLTLITHQRNNDKSDEIVLLYNSIKKYIKKNYVISSDKMILWGRRHTRSGQSDSLIPPFYFCWKRRFSTCPRLSLICFSSGLIRNPPWLITQIVYIFGAGEHSILRSTALQTICLIF